jgi:hypothetical protein
LFGEEERKKNKNKVFICALLVFFAERDAGSEEDSTTSTSNNSNRGSPQSSIKKLLSLEIEANEGMRESAADDQTNFQTEEWVRVSDFDVGTPTSITQEPQEEDYDAVAAATGDQEDDSSSIFGDFLQGLDRFADWETISSRDALGGPSSSLSDDWKKLLLVDQQGAADESIIAGSSSPERTFTLPYEVADERSRSEDVPAEQQKPDPESSTQPQESSEDSISISSEEEAHNPSTQQQQQDEDEDDDRSSSIVEITSSQAEQDEEEEEHGSLVEVPYPEEQGDEEEEEEEEDKVSSIVEVSSRPELDDDNYSSGIGDLVSLEDEENDDDQDGSVVVVVASIADPEDEDDRTFSCPESSISEEPNDDDDDDDDDDDEAHHHHLSLPPLTASVLEKLSIENHQAVAMISVAEEINGSEAEQFTSSQLLQEAQGNNSAEEPEETAPPLEQEETTHVPDEILDDTADSDKELLHQRKQQEEEIFAEEEENIGKPIAESLVEEPPLTISAVLDTVVTKDEMMLSEPLKCGEVEDLQPVAIEETGCKPFEEEDNMRDSQYHAPPLHDDDDDGAEMRNREKSGAEEEEGQAAKQNWNDAAAVEDDGEQQESAAMTEETLPIDPGAKPEVSVVVVVVGNTQPDALPAANEEVEVHSILSSSSANDAAESIVIPTEKEDNLVKARSSPSCDLPRSSLAEEEPNGCTAIASFFGKGFSMGGPGGPPIYLLQFISLQKSTEVSIFVHSVYSLLLARHFYNETYSWTTIITATTT